MMPAMLHQQCSISWLSNAQQACTSLEQAVTQAADDMMVRHAAKGPHVETDCDRTL